MLSNFSKDNSRKLKLIACYWLSLYAKLLVVALLNNITIYDHQTCSNQITKIKEKLINLLWIVCVFDFFL